MEISSRDGQSEDNDLGIMGIDEGFSVVGWVSKYFLLTGSLFHSTLRPTVSI